jgi:hypothetical protein
MGNKFGLMGYKFGLMGYKFVEQYLHHNVARRIQTAS